MSINGFLSKARLAMKRFFLMKHAARDRSCRENRFLAPVLWVLLFSPGPAMLYAQSYVAKDLGTLGGTLGSAANALNASGQVVGYSFTTNNTAVHATLFSGTGTGNLDLGTLGANANATSEANGINDSGQIIGIAANAATLFSGTGSNNFNLGSLGGNGAQGRAINNAGQMVGQDNNSEHAIRFSGTGSGNFDLGGLGGGVGIAYANNGSGQIVGRATTAAQADRATLFSGTGTGNLDLGTLGGFNSSAFGINDAGQIVGEAFISGNGGTHATLFSGTGSGNMDLGTLGGTSSSAYAINKTGVIVGNSNTAGNVATHAFIYTKGMMYDLNNLILGGSGVTNIRLQNNARVPGKCLNNAGQIAAVGSVAGGDHAILLSPATASKLGNISTRAFVQTGNNVLIGGLVIKGTAPKKVILRALGPTLGKPPFNIPNALANPVIELHDSGGALITSNDNWKSASNVQAIMNSGFAPPDDLESAILTNLNPGNYTAIVRGFNNATGVALVEGYDLDAGAGSKFTNISTRAFVQTGGNVMIAGVIVHGQNENVLVRALGPTLSQFNVPNVLTDPTLELRDANGGLLASNDNWKDTQQAQIQATGSAPPNDLESAILATLAPANYTAILRGKNNTTGNALLEAYALN
jgi:probable HAF family extracellular repeat protein